MPLTSMTGFARTEATHGAMAIQIEARCVNGRSSDIKLRLPNGFDHLDRPIRSAFQKVVRRGNANITLNLKQDGERRPKINVDTLRSLHAELAEQAERLGEAAPNLSELIGVPGVVELVDSAREGDEDAESRDQAILASVEACAEDLRASRVAEGSAMQTVLVQLVDDIAAETKALAGHPDARGEHMMARLKKQLDRLLADADQLDEHRLHQEAALLATKADIEEELARLRAHIDAARTLLDATEPVGRKLDFLAQEFNREANTICSKASTITVTQHGLALKALIDQVKEQVQNVE